MEIIQHPPFFCFYCLWVSHSFFFSMIHYYLFQFLFLLLDETSVLPLSAMIFAILCLQVKRQKMIIQELVFQIEMNKTDRVRLSQNPLHESKNDQNIHKKMTLFSIRVEKTNPTFISTQK